MGERLHLRGDLARLRLRRVRSLLEAIDTYARRCAGWRVSDSATAGFVLDALKQAFHHRRPAKDGGLAARSDHGSAQYLAIRYTEHGRGEIKPSVGFVGDSYNNALAETVIGLFNTEVIRLR